MELLKTSYLTVAYDSANKTLLQTWTAYCSSTQFREGIILSLKAIEKYRIPKLLSDIKKQSIVSNDDTKWLAEEIVPKLISAGLKYQAMILPESAFTKISVDNYQSNIKSELAIKTFRDRESALNWLKTCNE